MKHHPLIQTLAFGAILASQHLCLWALARMLG